MKADKAHIVPNLSPGDPRLSTPGPHIPLSHENKQSLSIIRVCQGKMDMVIVSKLFGTAARNMRKKTEGRICCGDAKRNERFRAKKQG